MVMIPLKLVPGLLILAGAVMLFEGGDGVIPGLIVGGVGAVWSYFWYIAPNLNKPKT